MQHEPSWYGPEDPGKDYEQRVVDAEYSELRPITKKEEEKMHSDRELWEKLHECYGEDFIIVHRAWTPSHGTEPYFITSSSNTPARTKKILRELVARFD